MLSFIVCECFQKNNPEGHYKPFCLFLVYLPFKTLNVSESHTERFRAIYEKHN